MVREAVESVRQKRKKSMEKNDLLKSQVLCSEWKTERVREDASSDSEDDEEDDDEMRCVTDRWKWRRHVRYTGTSIHIYADLVLLHNQLINQSIKVF